MLKHAVKNAESANPTFRFNKFGLARSEDKSYQPI